MSASFSNVSFIKTAVSKKGYPSLRDKNGDFMPEIGVAGRSNVGKSTLLNHLFRRKGIVKTSSVPGKTQALNFFNVDDNLVFVDFPGYGYAKVPTSVRRNWGPMIQDYFSTRDMPKGVLFLIDIRRTPNEDDICFVNLAGHYNIPLILIITKADKLTAGKRKPHVEKIRSAFDNDTLPCILYSSTKNIGRQQLIKGMEQNFFSKIK